MHQPTFTLFPYTTLFRSPLREKVAAFVHLDENVPALYCFDLIAHVARHAVADVPEIKIVGRANEEGGVFPGCVLDRKSTRLNSSHTVISYAVFCLKKKKK